MLVVKKRPDAVIKRQIAEIGSVFQKGAEIMQFSEVALFRKQAPLLS